MLDLFDRAGIVFPFEALSAYANAAEMAGCSDCELAEEILAVEAFFLRHGASFGMEFGPAASELAHILHGKISGSSPAIRSPFDLNCSFGMLGGRFPKE